MADVWGSMPKSSIDSQKIEEMVDQKISEHNDDPAAHTGGSRSLQYHLDSDPVEHSGVYPLKVLGSDPSSGSDGQIYFNSTAGEVRVYVGGAWKALAWK